MSLSIASSGDTAGGAVWSSTPKAVADATHPVMRWTIAESAWPAQERLRIVGSQRQRDLAGLTRRGMGSMQTGARPGTSSIAARGVSTQQDGHTGGAAEYVPVRASQTTEMRSAFSVRAAGQRLLPVELGDATRAVKLEKRGRLIVAMPRGRVSTLTGGSVERTRRAVRRAR